MDQPFSHLRISRSNDVSVVEFADRAILEEETIREIREELERVVKSEPRIQLLLNFRNVTHLSSAALGLLLKINKKISDQGGTLKLSDMNRQTLGVFEITRLDRVFEIHDTSAEALARFGVA